MKKITEKFEVKFIVALFITSLILGIALYFAYKPDLASYIDNLKEIVLSGHQNVFFQNILTITLIFIFSLTVLLLPLAILYIFYEGLSIGFTLGVFIGLFNIKGLLFYLVYFLVTKFIMCIINIYLTSAGIRCVYTLIRAFIKRRKEDIYYVLVKHFYRYVIMLIGCLLVSTFIYFFANKLIVLILPLIMIK